MTIKTVLITGGAGFIGSHTADRLLAAGYRVRILDNLQPPVHQPDTWPDYLSPDVERQRGDVRNRADWEIALNGVDAVIHLAAYQDYLPDFSTFFHVNVVSTALLYEIIVANNLPIQKVIVAGSQASYGEGKYRDPTTGELHYPLPRPLSQLQAKMWDVLHPTTGQPLEMLPTDEAVTTPHNSYAMSKIGEEQVALTLGQRYNIPSVSMRYSIVQGARQSFRNAYSGVLRIFAMQVLAGQHPTAYEDGQQLRDYVYVGDVAAANQLVLEDPRADFQAFNVGGGIPVTVNQFGNAMAQAAGRPELHPTAQGEFRFGDTRHIISDIGKLQGLGWQPTGRIETNIREYFGWATRQPGFGDYTTAARQHMQQVGALRGTNS